MATFIAISLFLIFLFLSGLHVYWALGGKWKYDAALPTNNDHIRVMTPGVTSTLAVAAGLLGFGLFVLSSAGLLWVNLPEDTRKIGLWVIAGIFILRAIGEFKYVGFFKKIRQTKFARNDTNYYSPACLVIGLLTIVLQLTK